MLGAGQKFKEVQKVKPQILHNFYMNPAYAALEPAGRRPAHAERLRIMAGRLEDEGLPI